MANRTIILKGRLGRAYEEAKLSVAAYPGYLLAIDNATNPSKVKPHAVAGGKWSRMILIEDDYQGRTYTTQYAIGDLARYVYADVGEMVQMVLKSGSSYSDGVLLKSAGDGTVTIATSGDTTDNVVGRLAMGGGIDLTSGVNTLAPVRVM